MKTIRTNDIINEKIWKDMYAKYGDNWEKLKKSHPVNLRAKQIYSQNGEEGMLEYIFDKIGYTNRVAVEFGAVDGKHLSNTCYFKEKYGFRRILMEGKANYKNNTDGEKIIYTIITKDNINKLLDDEKCPEDVDLMSIDIDGDDYWVWKAMRHKARVVIIEYHSAIPNNIGLAIIPTESDMKSYTYTYPFPKIYKKDMKPTKRNNGYYGANLKAFYELAKEKGYQFVTTNSDNVIFVRNDVFDKLGLPKVSLEECISKYFWACSYWYMYTDTFNREWVIV